MKTLLIRRATVGLFLPLLACARSVDDSPTPARPVAAHEEPSSADANLVRIDPEMMRDLRITTQPVESRSGVEEANILGELAVDEGTYAEVSAPVEARVMRLFANAGDSVARDSALAELSSSELGRARADYLSATAQVATTTASLARKKELAAERIVPLREVQEAEAAAADAQAAQRSAVAGLAAFGVPAPTNDLALKDASLFSLRSPVRGTVIERRAVLGQMLNPTTPAFRIGDLSTLWLTAHAFERDAVRIPKGAPAQLTFPALPGRSFVGTVTVIGRQVDRDSRTVPVRVTVENRSGLLRPGMSASASVPVGETGKPILSVPVASVQRVRNEWSVFIPRERSEFEVRRIGRGRDLAGEIEVLSGLKPGETVVVDGAFLLKAEAEKSTAGHDEH